MVILLLRSLVGFWDPFSDVPFTLETPDTEVSGHHISFPYNEALHRLDKEKLLDPEDKEQDMANSTVEFVIS